MDVTPIPRPVNRADPGRHLRMLLDEAIAQSDKDRAEIAHEMQEALGCKVTASMLNDFTRNVTGGRDIRFPAAWVPAFCEATGCDELRLFLLGTDLREVLELGDRVRSLGPVFEKIKAQIARLAARPAREKPKGKRRRKATRRSQ